MTLSPHRLLDHAQRLVSAGPEIATEEDLRRAVSAAYYALFHCVLGAVADLFSGPVSQNHPIYERIYRRLEHREIKSRSEGYSEATSRWTEARFDPRIADFAEKFVELYDQRIDADYLPAWQISHYEAAQAVETARMAIEQFAQAEAGAREDFLRLLVFPAKPSR